MARTRSGHRDLVASCVLAVLGDPNLHALGCEIRKVARVPICQPNAAVRRSLADGRRIGRAVDAIALAVEADPYNPHRVVGPGRNIELLLCVDAFEVERGIVVIDGVASDHRDTELAHWSGR